MQGNGSPWFDTHGQYKVSILVGYSIRIRFGAMPFEFGHELDSR
jgi:hypothetical protein